MLQLGSENMTWKRMFRATANPTEMDYVLPETMGVTRVHLLLGIKNTRIQPVLIRVSLLE